MIRRNDVMVACQLGHERQPEAAAAGAVQEQHRLALAAPEQVKSAAVELEEFAAGVGHLLFREADKAGLEDVIAAVRARSRARIAPSPARSPRPGSRRGSAPAGFR